MADVEPPPGIPLDTPLDTVQNVARESTMQTVYVCGGKGHRLQPRRVRAKSLVPVAGVPLLVRLASQFAPLHCSTKPPVVIVDADDDATPRAVDALLPGARIVVQRQADGVANALLLAQPLLDETVIVTLGDLFLDGSFPAIDAHPGIALWPGATDADTRQNFGCVVTHGIVSRAIEKPVDCRGLRCGIGVYVLTRSAISCFRLARVDVRTGERGITAGLQAAIEAGVAFRAIPFSGYYKNVNSRADVAEIERYLAAPVA
jgi:dTDP-glucose pyrophosphorylase